MLYIYNITIVNFFNQNFPTEIKWVWIFTNNILFLQWWCQILHVILHYFLLTNYAWMLAEGFYLHTLLVFAFTSEDTLVRWSWTLAWSTPLVVISLYTLLRTINDHTSEWVKIYYVFKRLKKVSITRVTILMW